MRPERRTSGDRFPDRKHGPAICLETGRRRADKNGIFTRNAYGIDESMQGFMAESGRLGVFYGGAGLRLVLAVAVVRAVCAEPHDAVKERKVRTNDETRQTK